MHRDRIAQISVLLWTSIYVRAPSFELCTIDLCMTQIIIPEKFHSAIKFEFITEIFFILDCKLPIDSIAVQKPLGHMVPAILCFLLLSLVSSTDISSRFRIPATRRTAATSLRTKNALTNILSKGLM